MERTILHIDMDAYFAAVEEQSNPFLKGRPVIVSGSPDTRTIVTTANYQARKFGIKSGMPLKQALRLCPAAEIVVADSAKYVDTTLRLLEIFRQFTPYIESVSIDEAFLDITGTKTLFGGENATAAKIKQAVLEKLGLTCSIGIAANKLLAKLASDRCKPDGLLQLKQEAVPELLKNLPVAKLCGIGEKTAAHLQTLGIRTCGDLAACPEETLVRLFGVTGRSLHAMGRGESSEPVPLFDLESEVKSMGHAYTLFRDTSNPDIVNATLCRLCEQVGRRLRRDQYQGRTVTLMLRLADFQTFLRQKSSPYHTADGRIIYRTALSILKTLAVNTNLRSKLEYTGSDWYKPVRLIGVSVSNLQKGSQPSLLESDARRINLLAQVDRINDRYGEFTVFPAALLMEKVLQQKENAGPGFVLKNKIRRAYD